MKKIEDFIVFLILALFIGCVVILMIWGDREVSNKTIDVYLPSSLSIDSDGREGWELYCIGFDYPEHIGKTELNVSNPIRIINSGMWIGNRTILRDTGGKFPDIWRYENADNFIYSNHTYLLLLNPEHTQYEIYKIDTLDIIKRYSHLRLTKKLRENNILRVEYSGRYHDPHFWDWVNKYKIDTNSTGDQT